MDRTRRALSDQGFGVLTEIDIRATLKSKLGTDMEDYLILGACNPKLAHRALDADRRVGVFLPCNVVLRSDPENDGVVIVDIADPQMMVQLADQPALHAVAEEAAARLHAVADALSRPDGTG
ncbi:ABC transporter, ATP-binding protein [Mycolicibacterium brisbanense]|uniref:ABC transporter, ATP-binding protein n=1 Tax=Mycolicibacterium brisbanense TaxID=146020 RepID=A0A100VUZ2_9MYCO|nr:ABC transporter, ATP-binding protein [Mycolicibacterium brisbanense]